MATKTSRIGVHPSLSNSHGTHRLISVFILALAWGLVGSPIQADDSSMLVRLKSGENYPQGNTIVGALTPLAVDWGYRVSPQWVLGMEFIYSSGNHGFDSLDLNASPPQDALFSLSEKQYLALATADYVFHYGNARISTGLKAGFMYFQAESTLSAGLVSTSVPPSDIERRFAFGPAVSIDVPVKGCLFLDVGGDYVVALNNNQLSFESLYVGIGIDF